jgi:multisubunit Na+/H+ antiporter MnhC subunit
MPRLQDALTTAAFFGGLALVGLGAWMVAPAAGIIVAGVELVLVGVGYAKGERPPAPEPLEPSS